MADKRIIELTNEKLILGDGDYAMIDSNEGTYKFKLKRIVDSIPAPDTTLSIAGRAADAAKTGEEIAGVKRDLNDKADTDGTYDGMIVGSSRQLLSENYLLDEEPYLFRASGGDGADRVDECIVGGSVAWNQMCGEDSDSMSSNGISIAFDKTTSKTIVIVSENPTGHVQFTFNSALSAYQGHKVLLMADKVLPNGYEFYSTRCQGGVRGSYPSPRNIATIIEASNKQTNDIMLFVGQSTAPGTYEHRFSYIDLTAMFGSTIADYIYSLEQSTAGAGVAWFKKYFPEDYYPYSAPTLRHVEGVSAKQIRDSDDNVTAIYPLDSSLTLRGIPKLTDGKMWFDGDKYNADGSVQRRYGIVDLGTLEWIYDTNNMQFYSSVIITISGWNYNVICSAYASDSRDASQYSEPHVRGIARDGRIYIVDPRYTDATALAASLSGVQLVYELATPTTEEADPYTAIQLLDPHGTEEFVSTGIVPVGHYSKYLENLRSKIEGLPKDFSTLIAPTEKAYKATQNYTVGSLLIVDNILYKVTSAIANGGTITPNTNVTATTLAAVIAAL